MAYSRTSLANRALDLVGKENILDMDTDTSAYAKVCKRTFEPIMLRCLRKSSWPWAITRLSLNPNATAPVNEYSYAFDMPGNLLKLLRVFPEALEYKIEAGQILCDDSTITIRYVNNDAVTDPSIIDPAFAEYFAHELAAAISYKLSDSVKLRAELKQDAFELYREAAGLYSQEDDDYPMRESPWIEVRDSGFADDGTIRIDGLET